MYQYIGEYTGDLEGLERALSTVSYGEAVSGYGASSWPQDQQIKDIAQPYLKDILPTEWLFTMLTVIHPDGILTPHLDGATREGYLRYHLVLKTNDLCWNFHDGSWQHMPKGSIWTIDPALIHASVNWGLEDRIHLVMDVKL